VPAANRPVNAIATATESGTLRMDLFPEDCVVGDVEKDERPTTAGFRISSGRGR
jgi:hypothetical protein